MSLLTRPLRYALVPYRAGLKWARDHCTTYAAALAYYSAFALAPVLVIAVSVAGLIFGREAGAGHLVEQLEGLVGRDGAQLLERMIAASYTSGEGMVAAGLGILAVLVGATGLFMQLGHAFEAIFGRPEGTRSAWVKQLKARLRGLTVVVGVGFLLMVSLVASAAILAFSEFATRNVKALLWVATALQIAITLALQTSMIAIIYRVLVPTPLSRRALLAGAVASAILFELGKWAVGVYLGRSSISSTYGAAGSLAVVLVWVYYVSLIMLYGAELTYQLERIHKVGGRVFRRPRRPPAPPEAAASAPPAVPALLTPPAPAASPVPPSPPRPPA